MKFNFVFLAVVLTALASCSRQPVKPDAEKGILMLTGFDPFGKSHVNYSILIAREIASHPEWIGDDVQVVACELPTVYDGGANAALDCVAKLPKKPELMVSMGEAACSIRLETAATNVDDADNFPDNAGVIRKGTPILAQGSKRLGLTLPAVQMYCALAPEDRAKVQVSFSPGEFVCNNTAYRMQTEVSKGLRIPYGFVHVPNSRCMPKSASVKGNARIIARMLNGAWKARHNPPAALPSLTSEVEKASAARASAPECEQDYWRALRRDITKNKYAY